MDWKKMFVSKKSFVELKNSFIFAVDIISDFFVANDIEKCANRHKDILDSVCYILVYEM